MVPLKYNFARKASHDYCWKSLEKKMQHNRKYRNLGWWAAHWLFYNLGRIQNDGNLNDGFWLIQKLDCFANKLKNPIILWSKLCIIWLFVYDYLLKLQLFSDFSPVCEQAPLRVMLSSSSPPHVLGKMGNFVWIKLYCYKLLHY